MNRPLSAIALAVVLALLAPVALGQGVQTYTVLDREDVTDDGRYAKLYDNTTGDTLVAWIEHVPVQEEPDRARAASADLVVWCYPKMKPHSDHIFPDSSGKIWVLHKGDKVTFYTEAGLEAVGLSREVLDVLAGA